MRHPRRRQQSSNQLVAATFTGASSPIYTNPTDTLTQSLVTGEYFRNRRYGGLVSFTRTTGTSDPLANGGNGSPANQYETFELDYVPWLNVRFILQYDAYQVVANNQNPFTGGWLEKYCATPLICSSVRPRDMPHMKARPRGSLRPRSLNSFSSASM